LLGDVGNILARSTFDGPEFMFLTVHDNGMNDEIWEMVPVTKSYHVRTLFRDLSILGWASQEYN